MRLNFIFSFKIMVVVSGVLFSFTDFLFALENKTIGFSFSNSIFSIVNQVQVRDTVRLSFGTNLNEDSFNRDDVNESLWSITHEGDVVEQGKGLSLFDYTFDKPGHYILNFQHDHSVQHDHNSCNHYGLPAELIVVVSSIRIEFYCNQMSFSRPIVGGVSMDGVTMNIPINVYTYSGNQEAVKIPDIISSYGILTTLIGLLESPFNTIAPGRHVLSYTLTGEATSGTYIGFDIIDNNGNVVPCGITAKIK